MESKTQKRILLVDDEKDFLDATEAHLKGVGYEILTAGSGEEALDIAWEKHPDLILLDIILPGMKGVEVCANLKSDPAMADIPIIFITAITSGDHADLLLEMGAEGYLVKPYTLEELEDKIKISLIRHETILPKKAA